jgi:hypothetical protein
MTVTTINKQSFELADNQKLLKASLIYSSNTFDTAMLETGETYLLDCIATGVWVTSLLKDGNKKVKSKMHVKTGGIISLILTGARKKYLFKKSAGWKLRFSLVNKDSEELLSIIPNVNWQKESHDYILQLNEEFEKECDSFIILQAVHCANCSLSMMTGGEVPALISI